ncbi:hypothetical protein [Burkholderia sp. BCC1972]|uniref:hypothetical protein n=1 Tax=Burkholderia sp. BCC1972 TaxID=2817438 RepID=UPI002ABDF138|nr:hypothetical protein [Burkholderia sp. BCC1972]
MNLSVADITPDERRLFDDLAASLEARGPILDARTAVLPAITQPIRAFHRIVRCDALGAACYAPRETRVRERAARPRAAFARHGRSPSID